MSAAASTRPGFTSVDDFPPLTDEQCARVVALLSLARPKPSGVTA